jgi:hypothetical protein
MRMVITQVNTYLGAMNAFCGWLHAEGHVAEPIKLAKLRVEKLPSLTRRGLTPRK